MGAPLAAKDCPEPVRRPAIAAGEAVVRSLAANTSLLQVGTLVRGMFWY